MNESLRIAGYVTVNLFPLSPIKKKKKKKLPRTTLCFCQQVTGITAKHVNRHATPTHKHCKVRISSLHSFGFKVSLQTRLWRQNVTPFHNSSQ